jgi:protein kinase A
VLEHSPSLLVNTFASFEGKSAFYRPDRKQIEMFKYIVRTDYELPPDMDETSKDLIKKLLVRNPAHRLGNISHGSKDIRDHPWFEEMNWTKLKNMELEAPWVPVIKEGDAVTASHLDASDGAYKEISFGRPLTREEQSIFKSF